MTLEPTNSPDEMNELTDPNRFPVRGWWKIFYGLFLLVIPAFSFWAVQALKPEWQSGDREAYVTLFLQAEASVFFLVFLAYSIICYILLLFDADRFAAFPVVRLGIYTGILLALQYTILLGMYLFNNDRSLAILLVWFLPFYVPRLYRSGVAKWFARFIRPWMIAVVLIAYIVIAYFIQEQAILPVFLVLLGIIASAPFWSLLIAIQASVWLFEHHETKFTLPRGLGIIAWVAGYAAAWRYNILKMYEMYSELPLVPPNCYIATAAAQGHPNFVGSRTVQLINGNSIQVNRQLQVFKCAELALLAVTPNAYRVLRKAYDSMGKPLARTIRYPFLADGAYLLLKPFEWIAGYLLKRLIPEIDSISIYN